MVAIGATVNEAFINSLQVSKDVLESILLSLHIRLGLKEKENGYRYRMY